MDALTQKVRRYILPSCGRVSGKPLKLYLQFDGLRATSHRTNADDIAVYFLFS